MKIRFTLCSLFLILILFLSACANPVAGNNSESVVFDGLSITWGDNGSPIPLSKFAGSYSSSNGSYDFNGDGTGTIGGANPSVRAIGGGTPFTWEIIAENANNANIAYGMLYVGNIGSDITFDTGKTPNTVTINGIEYGKGGMPIGDGSGNSGSSGGGNDGDSQGGGNTGGDSSGSSGGSGGQSGGSGSSGSTPESTPTDIGNGMKRIFAPGVTMASGWHDANKTPKGNSFEEVNLCWAATSANVVAWWQDRYNDLNPTQKINSSLPQTAQDVFQIFKNYWSDNTHGGFGDGIPWYFVGGTRSDKIQSDGGFLSAYTSANKWIPSFSATAYKAKQNFSSLADFSETVIDGLKKGAIAFGIVKNNAGYGHAITLWGAEYDSSTNIVKKVYVTDSDVINGNSLESYEISYGTYVTIIGHPYGYDRVAHILILYAP